MKVKKHTQEMFNGSMVEVYHTTCNNRLIDNREKDTYHIETRKQTGTKRPIFEKISREEFLKYLESV